MLCKIKLVCTNYLPSIFFSLYSEKVNINHVVYHKFQVNEVLLSPFAKTKVSCKKILLDGWFCIMAECRQSPN